MAEMSDDEFMNAGVPSASGEMSDDDFMNAKPQAVAAKAQPVTTQSTLRDVENAPSLTINPDDSMLQSGAKMALNAGQKILPYFVDRKDNISGAQETADVLKSGATGLGQAVVGAATAPVDVAHNVGEYAGNKIGQAITGVETQPQYSDYTGDAYKKLGLNYDPQSALGERLQLAASVEGLKGLKGAANIPANAKAAQLEKAAIPTQEQIQNVAGHTFKAAEEAGGALPPEATNSFIDTIRKHADQSDEGQLFNGASPLNAVADRMEAWRDKPMSFEGATEIDKSLTDKIQGETRPNGSITQLGYKYQRIQDDLRDAMEKPLEGDGFDLQNQAKALWAQQARMKDIDDMVARAQTMSNPALSLQMGARTLLNNGRRMQGFDEGDTALISRIASNPNLAGEMVRAGGSRLLGLMGVSHGPITGLATQTGNYAARKFAEQMRMRPVNQLRDRLATRNELPDLSGYNPVGVPQVKEPEISSSLRTYGPPTGTEGTAELEVPYGRKPTKKNGPVDKFGPLTFSPDENKHGGRIRTGKIIKKPLEYPALKAKRQ
jgi:hypothetical protein